MCRKHTWYQIYRDKTDTTALSSTPPKKTQQQQQTNKTNKLKPNPKQKQYTWTNRLLSLFFLQILLQTNWIKNLAVTIRRQHYSSLALYHSVFISRNEKQLRPMGQARRPSVYRTGEKPTPQWKLGQQHQHKLPIIKTKKPIWVCMMHVIF